MLHRVGMSWIISSKKEWIMITSLMQDDTHLTSSLLKMFSMFEICLICGDDDLDKVCLKCVNCKKDTGLNAETGFKEIYDEVITQFLLNAMLHHVSMSWIISSK